MLADSVEKVQSAVAAKISSKQIDIYDSTIVGLIISLGAIHVARGPNDATLRIPFSKSRP
jgi:hypothetical protein